MHAGRWVLKHFHTHEANFLIDMRFAQGVGTVVFGMLNQGTLKVNDVLLMGPDWSGKFEVCIPCCLSLFFTLAGALSLSLPSPYVCVYPRFVPTYVLAGEHLAPLPLFPRRCPSYLVSLSRSVLISQASLVRKLCDFTLAYMLASAK